MSPITKLRKQWQNKIRLQLTLWVGFGLLVTWSIKWLEFDFNILFKSGPRFSDFFLRLNPPDWSVSGLIVNSMMETLMIALAGTVLAIIFSLPLGLLASSNVTPNWIHHPVKWFLGVMRSIPLIVVAIVFVIAVGLGPFPGVLAIAFHSIGMLGKFYAEEFETANRGIINAVEGTGATWTQTLRFGLFPQCIPQILSFSLYRFEMNFRDATVLGLVGAGGIGYYINLYVRGFQYNKVAVLLIVIVMVVTVLDQITFWILKRVQ